MADGTRSRGDIPMPTQAVPAAVQGADHWRCGQGVGCDSSTDSAPVSVRAQRGRLDAGLFQKKNHFCLGDPGLVGSAVRNNGCSCAQCRASKWASTMSVSTVLPDHAVKFPFFSAVSDRRVLPEDHRPVPAAEDVMRPESFSRTSACRSPWRRRASLRGEYEGRPFRPSPAQCEG